MTKVLPQNFFRRPALKIAKELLGKFLVRRIGRKNIAVIITETEAYVGPQDLASHASRGRTARTEVMFGEAGRFYVYFTYGMHWMLNVVTDKKDYPSAVLLRAGNIIKKSPYHKYHKNLVYHYASDRKHNGIEHKIDGPARLTKFLKIDKRFNGKLSSRRTGLWFEDRGIKIKPSQIKRGPRIGVDYAGKWAKKPYNFKLKQILC